MSEFEQEFVYVMVSELIMLLESKYMLIYVLVRLSMICLLSPRSIVHTPSTATILASESASDFESLSDQALSEGMASEQQQMSEMMQVEHSDEYSEEKKTVSEQDILDTVSEEEYQIYFNNLKEKDPYLTMT